MATLHLFATYCFGGAPPSAPLGDSRIPPAELAHLLCMDTTSAVVIEQILSLSELCAHLHVSAQTINDLRSQGRGPRGSRVGRELRFRVSEVEAWLTRLEQDDGLKHTPGRR